MRGIYGSLKFLKPNRSYLSKKDDKKAIRERTYITSTLEENIQKKVQSETANNNSVLSNIFSVNNLSIQFNPIEEISEGGGKKSSKLRSFKIDK